MHIHRCTTVLCVAQFSKSEEVSIDGKSYNFGVDLNWMEILKRKLADKQPSSVCSMVDLIKNVSIRKICVEYFQNLISIIPRHIQTDTEQRKTYKLLCGIFNVSHVVAFP